MQNSSLWRYIDVSQVEASQSDDLVAFLQRYTCHATRFLRLGRVGDAILQVIQQNCTSLQQLSLTINPTVVDLSVLPETLQWLRTICVRDNESCRMELQLKRFAETPLMCLEYLSIKGAVIDDVFCQRMTGSRTLRQLRLDHCLFQADAELQKDVLGRVEMIELADCRFESPTAFHDTIEIIGRNANLLGFGLTDPSFTQPVPVGFIALDNLFQSICVNGNLRYLSVNAPGFCTIKESTFVSLFRSLHNLEILSLEYNQSMSDRVLQIAIDDNRQLMILNLYGNRCITDEGLQSLSHHPTLRALSVGSCLNLTPAATLQIAATLPKLIFLGMSRPSESCTELSQFEIEKPEVVFEYFYNDWVRGVSLITQILSEYEMKDFI